MTRHDYRVARRAVRTLIAYCREAVRASMAGDLTLVLHLSRWMRAEYEQIPQEDIELAHLTTRQGAALTTQMGMIRSLPDQRSLRIDYVRAARFRRVRLQLPR